MKDLSQYEGRTIGIISKFGMEHSLTVALAEENFGLTLVLTEDKSKEKLCIIGPDSPKFTEGSWECGKKMIEYIVKCLETCTPLKYDELMQIKADAYAISVEAVSSCAGKLQCAFK